MFCKKAVFGDLAIILKNISERLLLCNAVILMVSMGRLMESSKASVIISTGDADCFCLRFFRFPSIRYDKLLELIIFNYLKMTRIKKGNQSIEPNDAMSRAVMVIFK